MQGLWERYISNPILDLSEKGDWDEVASKK